MEIAKWKLGTIMCVVVLATILATAFLFTSVPVMRQSGEIPFSFSVGSIHTTITIYKDGKPFFSEYHAGAVTKLGLNVTLAKLTGDSWYNLTTYMLNTTYIGIGNQGTLNTDSVILPGEWNRTLGTIHDQAYDRFNITATFHPGAGPYTADCIGLYYESAGNNLWGYDTFTEVTGIDSTFTIVVEIKVSAS